jgi:exodeoxyribonuclease V beta subunit
VISSLVEQTLDLPLDFGFCLRDVDQSKIRVEAEFIFQEGANYLKGFIDLLFVHEGKLYFVDWKTNWLSSYSEEKIAASMSSHQYDLQAAIYTEALRREWAGEMGGAIYFFVRGPKAICFTPRSYGRLDA